MSNPALNKANWYVIYTKSRWEKKVFDLLSKKNIEAYLPVQKVLKTWSDRKKWVEEPLFRSYIFVKTSLAEQFNVQATEGIVSFVKFGEKFATIDENTIQSIKILLSGETELQVIAQTFKKGEPVVIDYGQFHGIEGKVVSIRGKYRVVVEIESIGQSILINVPITNLVKSK